MAAQPGLERSDGAKSELGRAGAAVACDGIEFAAQEAIHARMLT